MSKLRLYLLVFPLLFSSLSNLAQDTWKELFSFNTEEIDKISTDSYSNIYISSPNGVVTKYDSLGNVLLKFSPPKKSRVSYLDGSRNVNIFLFYKNFQEIKLLSRFLTDLGNYDLSNEKIGYASLCAPSSDNTVWIIDDNDLSLKKFNFRFNSLEISNSLLMTIPRSIRDYNFTYLRAYNTSLYIAEKNSGILVFDNLGNYQTLIPSQNIDFFAFWQNQLYFIDGKNLKVLDISKGKMKEFTLALPEGCKIILSQFRAYLFTENTVKVFSHNLFN